MELMLLRLNNFNSHHDIGLPFFLGSWCCCFSIRGDGCMDHLPIFSSRRALHYWRCTLCCRFWQVRFPFLCWKVCSVIIRCKNITCIMVSVGLSLQGTQSLLKMLLSATKLQTSVRSKFFFVCSKWVIVYTNS